MEGTHWYLSPFWNTFWGQFLIEIVGGIVSAFIFLFLVLFFLKPKIKIAKFLCKIKSSSETYYIFKFVNMSFFAAHEVKVELHKIRKIPVGSGKHNNQHEKLNIMNGNISHIPARPLFWKTHLGNPDCVIVRSIDNLNEILSDELNAVLLRISLKHGLTGLSEVFDQEYGETGDIREGRFKPGKKFET